MVLDTAEAVKTAPSAFPLSQNGIPLLPETFPRAAPATRRVMTRAAAMLAAYMTIATVLTFAFGGGAFRAVGLSMVFPGGGLLYTASPFLALVALLLFWGGLVAWWGVSAFLAPWIAIAVSALVAALLVDGPRLFVAKGTTWDWAIYVAYAGFAVALGTYLYKEERRYRSRIAEIPELNAYLSQATPVERDRRPLEPTEVDARHLKWAYELALQPFDEFEGFDHGEQFHGGTCLRYQLQFLGAALSVANANLLPNYPEVITKAQERLIEKNTDLRVWRYWRVESILGNLDWNPDPMIHDNIMLSGFLLSQIGEFEAATGSKKFDEQGCLKFVWRDGRTFEYDHHRLAEVVSRNFISAEMGLFPCEPGWVFAFCNANAAEGVKAHQTMHGGSLWDETEPVFRAGMFGELMTPNGRIRHIRNNMFGFTFRDGETDDYFTTGHHHFVDTAPDMHRRGTALAARHAAGKLEALRPAIRDGVLRLPIKPKPDRSTRYLTALGEWLGVYNVAKMMGDGTLADAAFNGLVDACGSGEDFPSRPFDGPIMATALALNLRWSAPMSTGELVLRGYVPPVGPVLEHAPWPELLVSKARCEDGTGLDLTIEPHRASPDAEHELTFKLADRARPHRLTGPNIDVVLYADQHGRARAAIPCAARTSLTLRPE